MNHITSLIVYNNSKWLNTSINSFQFYFPNEKILIVDNNKTEIKLSSRKNVTYLKYEGESKKHGSVIDFIINWCKNNNIDILVHIEPDCTILGKEWFNNLLNAIYEGYWMAGCCLRVDRSIHITPTAWLTNKVDHTFMPSSKEEKDEFIDLLGFQELRSQYTLWDKVIAELLTMHLNEEYKPEDLNDLCHLRDKFLKSPKFIFILGLVLNYLPEYEKNFLLKLKEADEKSIVDFIDYIIKEHITNPQRWDTGGKNWFIAHKNNKAKLVQGKDIFHFLNGSEYETGKNELCSTEKTLSSFAVETASNIVCNIARYLKPSEVLERIPEIRKFNYSPKIF